ncbi:MAG: aminotransferase class I/II-fold pyridoxal phosphate-dependent enzyme, partial [Bacillati bacterium ANGP1]
YIVTRLNALPGVRCGIPRGAFYAFPDITGLLGLPGVPKTAAALSEYLLEKAHVAVVPGEAFEAPGFLRFSYATALPRIEEGLDRIARAIAALV